MVGAGLGIGRQYDLLRVHDTPGRGNPEPVRDALDRGHPRAGQNPRTRIHRSLSHAGVVARRVEMSDIGEHGATVVHVGPKLPTLLRPWHHLGLHVQVARGRLQLPGSDIVGGR